MGVLTQTFHGIPGGINQALSPWEIPNQQAVWIQDALLDQPGILRKRGPVKATADVSATISTSALSLHQTLAKDGKVRLAYLGDRAAPKLHFLSASFNAVASISFPGTWTAHDPVWDSKPALSGGTFIGAAETYTSTVQGLALWRGGTKAAYSTGTISTTRNSKTVTGTGTTWTTNVEPGMFVIGVSGSTETLVGSIASVDGNGTLTLEQNAVEVVTGSAYTIQSVRGLRMRCVKGRITGSTTATRITGAGTKFKMMAAGWLVFRLSDMTYIGTVGSITNDTSLELQTNAAINVSNDRFVGIPANGTNFFTDLTVGTGKAPGFLTAVYQGRQFYASGSRVWFSDPTDPEGVDISPADGDFFDVIAQGGANSPIVAVAGLQNALAILKENELYALFGSDPSQFQLRKIADVGALSTNSIQVFEHAMLFASRSGVYMFDGARLQDMTASLGEFWRVGILGFNNDVDRAYSMQARNHYMLSLSTFASPYAPTKGRIAAPITKGTLAINLSTGAITWMTNLAFKGSVELPPNAGKGTWFVVEKEGGGSAICDTAALWTDVGSDSIQCAGHVAGPDWYIETKRYDMGDATRKKLFKQMILEYKLAGDSLSIDTVVGLNDSGTTSVSTWLPSTDYTAKRIKFVKRATHLGVRLWETAGTANVLEIGPWSLGFKWQRAGRV